MYTNFVCGNDSNVQKLLILQKRAKEVFMGSFRMSADVLECFRLCFSLSVIGA